MIFSIKAMVVVLALGIMVFRFGKPIALLLSSEPDFNRRRNVWFVLTVTAFLSPNFWLFVLIAAPLLLWAGRKDSNPVALYLILLHVIPPIPVYIPVVGIGRLFELDNYRLLSFCVLIPAAWRLKRLTSATRVRGLTAMDITVLAFGLVQLFNFVPPDLPDHTILKDSATNVLRRGFLFFVDIYVLYFAVSRFCGSRRALVETLGTFCLASAVMASVAVFEMFKGWLLFSKMGELWGIQHVYGTQYAFYFVRFGFLRAQASAGHASSLGYLLAIAFGFWLSLKSQVKSARLRFAVSTLFCLGLLASQARGPILGAVVIYIVFSILGPRAAPRFLKALSVLAILVGALSFTAFGEQIMNSIPFFGQRTDDASVNYRQRLAERSWELIQLHPFLGDPLVLTKMEDLRQGEGIIDLVNTYAGVTLFYGSIGLLAFLAPIVLGLFKVYRVRKEIARRDPAYASLGVSLAASIIGTFFIISSNSPIYGYEKMFYILAGLAAAYAYVGTLSERR